LHEKDRDAVMVKAACDTSLLKDALFLSFDLDAAGVYEHLRKAEPLLPRMSYEDLTGAGGNILENISPIPRTIIFVAFGRAQSALSSAASLAAANNSVFVPLLLESAILRLGPIIVPGSSGCWSCWSARQKQHDPHLKESQGISQFYDQNPRLGPVGNIDPFAQIAAAQLCNVLCSEADLLRWSSLIWQLDTFTHDVVVGKLIGLDGCPDCGLGRTLGSRSYLQLREALRTQPLK
jgi:hypothetical protein